MRTLWPGLSGDDPLAAVRLLQRSLSSQSETRPGLVALYNIWSGNWASLFLQPWSLHGAFGARVTPMDDSGTWKVPWRGTQPCLLLNQMATVSATLLTRFWSYFTKCVWQRSNNFVFRRHYITISTQMHHGRTLQHQPLLLM